MSVDILYGPPCRAFFLFCAQVRARNIDAPADRLRILIKQRIDELLVQFESHTFLNEKLSLVEYALVASADEAVLSVPDALSEQWLLRPLQLERFNEYHAGNGFFVRLAALRKAERPDETLLHLYWLCLQHGFSGELILESALARENFLSGFYKELKTVPALPEEVILNVARASLSKSDLMVMGLGLLAVLSLFAAASVY